MLLQSYHPVIQRLLEDAAQHCPKLMMEGWFSKRTVLKGHMVRQLAMVGLGVPTKDRSCLSTAKIMTVSHEEEDIKQGKSVNLYKLLTHHKANSVKR